MPRITTDFLENKRIIVTGCGYTKLQTVFTGITDGRPTHDQIIINGEAYKANMGAVAARTFISYGALVQMVSRSAEKLQVLQKHITPNKNLSHAVVDLMDESAVAAWATKFCFNQNQPLFWFHCVGQSAGSYKPIANRWLPFQHLTLKHFSTEVLPFWATTVNVAKHLWPLFERQKETRIVLVSSMSAVRGYPTGASHCAAEAAMDRLANVLTLEGYKKNIFVTTLRAGAIDTGTYESKEVQEAVTAVSDSYDGRWRREGITLAPPRSIGELAACAFSIPAHVTSMNIVAQGQWPHEGS